MGGIKEHHMSLITVYGAEWCEDTRATRTHPNSLGVPFRYVDVEADAAAGAWVKQQNGGKRQAPTVDIDGKVLIEPDERELEEGLRGTGLMS
jgi:mycoredoxin